MPFKLTACEAARRAKTRTELPNRSGLASRRQELNKLEKYSGQFMLRQLNKIAQRLSHHQAASADLVSESLKCFSLKGYRSLINIRGPDAGVFLQGLITNDINRLGWPNNQVIYAMLLNNRGRTLFDTLIYNLSSQKPSSSAKEQEPNYLLEIDFKQREQALRYFKMYRLKKKFDLALVDDRFALFSLFGDGAAAAAASSSPKSPIGVSGGEPIVLQDDPRWEELGKRLLVQSSNPEGIKLKNEQVDLKAYKAHLYKHGVPENNDDFKFEGSIPLEYNLVFMNGVQFDKGCYLGQELVAKTHHTGVIRKRVMPLRLLDSSKNAEFEPNAQVLNTKTNRPAGKLINISNGFGIGLLRLENLDPDGLVVEDAAKRQHPIRVSVPGFWKKDSLITDQLISAYSS